MGSRSALATQCWRRQRRLLGLETSQHRFQGTDATELSATKLAPEASTQDELGLLRLESTTLNDDLEPFIILIHQEFRSGLKPGQALQSRRQGIHEPVIPGHTTQQFKPWPSKARGSCHKSCKHLILIRIDSFQKAATLRTLIHKVLPLAIKNVPMMRRTTGLLESKQLSCGAVVESAPTTLTRQLRGGWPRNGRRINPPNPKSSQRLKSQFTGKVQLVLIVAIASDQPTL
jgi:hypothetical protein